MANRVAALAALLCLVAAAPRARATACDYTASANYDLNGGDLPNQPVSRTLSTLDECAALCCAAGFPCAAFSLNAGGAGGRACYLKAKSGWQNGSSPGCDSGILSAPPPPPEFPWFNLTLSRPERLAALLAAMTLDEQISWLNNAAPALPRLGLPAYDWEGEASHGVAWAGVSTAFPSPIAWGASFNVDLVSQIARVIATEARAKFIDGMAADGGTVEFRGLSFMTPNNNLFVSPHWGRGQETNGEDPILTAAMTAAMVTALQTGDQAEYDRMIAVSKHWLGYHIESWDGDEQYRLSHSFNYTETDLLQYYLVPFVAAVSANVSSVMCAYDGMQGTIPGYKPLGPEPWGVPMCLHPNLQSLLRDTMGFKGYIISDEGAVTFAGPGYHDFTKTVKDAACLALAAGTDLCLGGEYATTLGACVKDGNATAAQVTLSLGRVLTAQFRLGYFDTLAARLQGINDPVSYNNVSVAADVATPAHRALSREAARQGLVLLKNSNATLPLDPATIRTLALVGPNAEYSNTSTGAYIGNYPGCVDGPGDDLTKDARCHVTTLHEALRGAASTHGFALTYAPGCDVNTRNESGFAAAIAAARGVDIIIAAVGLDTCQESACSEGEAHDRLDTLDLPGSQLPLLQALVAAYPTIPLILVLMNGGPVSSPWAFSHASAVLEAWYPGPQGGGAVTDALFRDGYSPAGRLPVTVLSDMGQLPPYTSMVMDAPPG